MNTGIIHLPAIGFVPFTVLTITPMKLGIANSNASQGFWLAAFGSTD